MVTLDAGVVVVTNSLSEPAAARRSDAVFRWPHECYQPSRREAIVGRYRTSEYRQLQRDQSVDVSQKARRFNRLIAGEPGEVAKRVPQRKFFTRLRFVLVWDTRGFSLACASCLYGMHAEFHSLALRARMGCTGIFTRLRFVLVWDEGGSEMAWPISA